MHSATYVDELNALLDTSSPPSLTEADDQRGSEHEGADGAGASGTGEIAAARWVDSLAACAA